MSNTIAHRPHVQHHVPVMPVLAVVIAIAIAALVIWAVNQPQNVTITTGSEAGAAYVQPAIVATPESPVFRHAQKRVLRHGGYPKAYLIGRLHQVEGATLDPVTTLPFAPSGSPAYRVAK